MILFVCSQGFIRSRTAEIMATLGGALDVRSVGTDANVVAPVTREALVSAKAIYCMENEHKLKVLKICPEVKDKVVVLGIQDIYERHVTDLVDRLTSKLYQFDEVLSDQIRSGSEILYERNPHLRKLSDNALNMGFESSLNVFNKPF